MVNYEIGLSGQYKVTVLRDKKPIVETDWINNLVLDSFIDGIDGTWFDNTCYILVGTGTTPPQVTDTTLENSLGFASGIPTNENPVLDANYIYSSRVFTATFNLGAIVGNVSELGMNLRGSSAIVDTRTLIKDIAGNPTTITVTAQDQLVISYKHTMRWPRADVVSVVDVGGVPTTVTLQAGTAAQLLWFKSDTAGRMFFCTDITLGQGGDLPTYSGQLQSILLSYAKVGFGVVEYTASLGINQANPPQGEGIAGAPCVNSSTSFGAGLNIKFDPPIAKDDTKTLTIKFRKTFGRI